MRSKRTRTTLGLVGLCLAVLVPLAAPGLSWGWYSYGYDEGCADTVRWRFDPPLRPPLEPVPARGTVTITYRGTLRCAQSGATVYEQPPQAYPNASGYPAPQRSAQFEYFGNCAHAWLTGITHPGLSGELTGSTAYIAGERDQYSQVSALAEVHHLVPAAQTMRSFDPPAEVGELQCGATTASGYAVWDEVRGGRV